MVKTAKSLIVLLMVAVVGLTAGCGGGGGDSANSASVLTLTLATANAPAGSQIGGVQGSITLPAGSSIRTEGSTEVVPGDLFAATGNAASSLAGARYASTTGTFTYALVNAAGFTGGDFATLQIDLQPGVSMSAANFILSASKVVDISGNSMDVAVILK